MQRHSGINPACWQFWSTISLSFTTIATRTQVYLDIDIIAFFVIFVIFLENRCVPQKLLLSKSRYMLYRIDMHIQMRDIVRLGARLIILFVNERNLILVSFSIKCLLMVRVIAVLIRLDWLDYLFENSHKSGSVFLCFYTFKAIWLVQHIFKIRYCNTVVIEVVFAVSVAWCLRLRSIFVHKN